MSDETPKSVEQLHQELMDELESTGGRPIYPQKVPMPDGVPRQFTGIDLWGYIFGQALSGSAYGLWASGRESGSELRDVVENAVRIANEAARQLSRLGANRVLEAPKEDT